MIKQNIKSRIKEIRRALDRFEQDNDDLELRYIKQHLNKLIQETKIEHLTRSD